MRIFLDTANINEIRQAAKLGIISGVTTNPSLVAKENRCDLRDVIREITSIINGPISAEVLSSDPRGMIEEAQQISSWSPNVVVKIPISAAGLEAISALCLRGIKTNMTLCFSLNQAILGALAGATYVSPFVGRLDDIGHDGMALIAEMVKVFRQYGFPSQVIAASIRHPLHCVAAARAGAHIATVPYRVLMQMIDHPLTERGISLFAADWQRIARG
ncbi:MAG: fructose-6-phosphate aldolase [Dehalococcoidia bacterium]|nr:Transaldolase [Chloroflexota bacterium]MBT9159647.1 Transaldolase [Chloroflexota bacterium]MBT9161738.1 Transaldolase [Chloroflexota bacterium]